VVFTSFEFIFVFLPVTVLLFYIASRLGSRYVAILMLATASLIFYGWWKWEYTILLGASIITNYLIGRGLQRMQSRALLSVGVFINLSLLGYYKYTDFFISSINSLSDQSWSLWGIALPLAISFYTFQQIAYLIDVYRGVTKETSFANYALFVCFFPQFIAGPIVHHSETIPQFEKKGFPRFSANDIAVGATLFLIGFNKKVVIADSVAVIANQLFDNALEHPPNLFEAWGGTVAYTFQIYFDFSGYSDMAIGLARMFGIKLPINFHSPYKSFNIIQFWRHWHMTLSRFLRDYLYIPLGGGRKGRIRRYGNIMIVMLLGGLWHGAGWTYVVWGGLHGVFLAVNHAWHALRRKLGHTPHNPRGIGIWIGRAITIVAVMVAWVFFRAEDMASAIIVLEGMSGLNGVWMSVAAMAGPAPMLNGLDAAWLLLLLGVVWLLPNSHELLLRHSPALNFSPKSIDHKPHALSWGAKLDPFLLILERWRLYLLVCFISGTITIGALVTISRGQMSTEFIYFMF